MLAPGPAAYATAFQDGVPGARRYRPAAREIAYGRREAQMSQAGFDPKLWGPSAWRLMHLVAATYPERPTTETKRQYESFFRSLEQVLPCAGCREGYSYLINGPVALTPAVLADRVALFRWTVEVHNAVNAKLGKEVLPDWMTWYRHYDRMRS